MKNNCSEDGCENPVHVNVNGIRFDKCRKHYLKSMSTLRESKVEQERDDARQVADVG